MTEYQAEQKKEHDRAVDFLERVRPGDTVRLERYAYQEHYPYCLNRHADEHKTGTVRIYAVMKDVLWFTTYAGEAIDARTIIAWEKILPQLELGI